MSSEHSICIAYLIDSITCDTAGTEKQLLETIRRLDKVRFEPYLICLWQSEWMAHNELPCPCIVLGYRGFLKLSFLGVVWRLSKFIRDRKIQIIQTFFEDSIFVGLLGKFVARVPLVLLSSRRDIGLGSGSHPWYHSLFTLALPWVNRYFSGIIANCEQVRQYVSRREKTATNKIKVIRNGTVIFDRPAVTPSIFFEKDKIIWIGLVASLTTVKRHDVLIKALSELVYKRLCLQHRIVFIGEGPEHESLVNLVSKHGLQRYVHFAGVIKDVSSYLYNLDIGVLCSDREGLSNAILEYMACGLPVVVTSVGGNIELVDETNGICFPQGDYHALASSLQKLMEDEQLRKKLGRGSLTKIQQSYSWEKTMTELEDYYLSLVGNCR